MMKFPRPSAILIAFLAAIFALQVDPVRAQSGRVAHRPLVIYDFSDGGGSTIHDRSANGDPLDLVIDNPNSVRWSKESLSIESSARIGSSKPVSTIVKAVKQSRELTIEVWIKPANLTQSGPARIVSLSQDTSQRNFTLGQDQDFYDVRLRTSKADRNGLPSTAAPKKSVRTKLTHVVMTRNVSGSTIIYVDGKQLVKEQAQGDFSSWDTGYPLNLGNEATGDRPWLGEFHLVALYDVAFSAREVKQNFDAGATSASIVSSPDSSAAAGSHVFSTQIAPLFARHCLECHDSAIKKGGLDLSRKVAALKGGESGVAITPGKSADSLLWDSITSGDMPKDRAPLSNEEKAALRQWIDDGAVWPVETIDPAIYVHGGHTGQVWVQRLTIPEYVETVRAAVGVDIAAEARDFLPRDLRADGFSNTAYNLNVDLKHVEAYSRLAEIIVGRMDVLKFAARFSKSRSLSTDDTMRDQVAAMGKWLFRGPLEDREVTGYSGIATTVSSAGGDFQQAMTYIIEAMLQSPRFVYRMEYQRGDGRSRNVGPYELASRLSYILWGAPPDEELMRAADADELADPAQFESQVQRMLKDQRTKARSSQFISEWLNLPRLSNLRPDPKRFPSWNDELASDMREETLAYFHEVVWVQNRPLADLLNTQVTFATPALARHYGIDPVGDELSKYDLSSTPGRGGLLTQGSVLTVGGDEASMVSRGLFMLHDLLRGTINAPPPCVNTTPPPTKAGLTQRGIAEGRIADVNCGVCHVRFEPLAFGLEKFDGVGAFHEVDQHGNALRDDGEILFPGEAMPLQYKSSAELMDLLAASPRVQASLTWKVTQFALGRPLNASDAPTVASIHQAAQQNGGTYPSLMTAIVTSDLVQKSRTEKSE